MKNATIKKINTLGKVSRIIVTLIMIVNIAGIVATSLGAAALASIPKDAIQITGDMDAQVVVDESQLSDFGKMILKSGTLVQIPEMNVSVDKFGTDFTINVKETRTDEQHYSYDIEGDISQFNSRIFGIGGIMACLGGILILVALLVAVIFGGKLAKALSVCQSPFEENVLKKMKAFGFSLIPFAVVNVIVTGIGLLTALAVIVIILFVLAFNYGAELQKESDETV